MSKIQYFRGCEPDNPDRPKAQVVQYLLREVVVERLAGLRANLEEHEDPKGQVAFVWWLLLDDVLDCLEITDPAERLQVMGENVTAILEAILSQQLVLTDDKPRS